MYVDTLNVLYSGVDVYYIDLKCRWDMEDDVLLSFNNHKKQLSHTAVFVYSVGLRMP